MTSEKASEGNPFEDSDKDKIEKPEESTTEYTLNHEEDDMIDGNREELILNPAKLLTEINVEENERKVTFESEKIIVSKEDSTEKLSNGKIEVGRKLNISSWEDFLKGIILQ